MRKKTRQIFLGDLAIGGDAPISIQSMTNTDTKDVEKTVEQILKLEEAGCDLIRFAVNTKEDALAIPKIKDKIHIPTIADIQFNHQLALYALENGIDGLRINPGNIGETWKVKEVVNLAKAQSVPIRIGVNSGSVHQKYIDKFHGVNVDSLCYSALDEVKTLEDMGFYDIKVSIKSSDVSVNIEANRKFSALCDCPLHLGVTEAGNMDQGLIKSAVGIGSLLHDGIGDTIRISLTDDPVKEVEAAKILLRTLGLRREGVEIVSCPTCARTTIDLISLVNKAKERLAKEKRPLKIAIMGCPVNGPGESREADYGISGAGGKGYIFKKGEILKIVEEDQLLDALMEQIDRDEE